MVVFCHIFFFVLECICLFLLFCHTYTSFPHSQKIEVIDFFYFLKEIMRPMRLRRFIYYLTWGSCCVIREPGVNLIMIIKFVAANLRYLFINSRQWSFLPSLPFLLYFWDVWLRFFLFLKNSLLNSKNCIFHTWFLLWLKRLISLRFLFSMD